MKPHHELSALLCQAYKIEAFLRKTTFVWWQEWKNTVVVSADSDSLEGNWSRGENYTRKVEPLDQQGITACPVTLHPLGSSGPWSASWNMWIHVNSHSFCSACTCHAETNTFLHSMSSLVGWKPPPCLQPFPALSYIQRERRSVTPWILLQCIVPILHTFPWFVFSHKLLPPTSALAFAPATPSPPTLPRTSSVT